MRLALRDPFVIARSEHGGGHEVTTIVVELRDDRFPGVVGVGEGYPDSYYGETPETMVAGGPLHAFPGLPRELPPTDFTIGIDAPAVVAERAARAANFPALKIKVGGPADLATLEAVRAVFAGPIRVDANTGWSP